MSRKTKCIICCGTAALALLVGVSAPHIGQEPTPQPHVRPVSAFVREDRVIPPPKPPPALAGKETANTEPNSTPPTEIAFEAQKPNAVSEILTTQEPPRGKPTPTPSPPQTAGTVTVTEPESMSME